MKCKDVYETGLLYHHYANTAYPLTPLSFMKYKLRDDKEIEEFVKADWKNAEELSLYIHVPFCKSRCKFCEYVVLEGTDDSVETEYVDLLLKEMEMYSEILKGKKIVGYDLGGGTPTKLSIENLRRITEAVKKLFNVGEDVIFSIETTPIIAASEPEKIREVYEMGYKRISMGIQTVSERLLSELGREGSTSVYEKAVANIRSAGFERFNIDLMYGFLHQTDNDFRNTIRYAVGLNPEYITLYRNRYKGTKIEHEAGGVSIYKAMYLYKLAYNALTESGYMANVGKNTFSRIEDDYGTSDYLTGRVINGTPYVGMGLGAQSFGVNYLAYNLGAAEKRMERYKKSISEGRLPFQDIYPLPMEETIAKMVSVAFYFAFVDLKAFKSRFGVDFCEYFRSEVDFVLEKKLMEIRGDRIYLTDKGADFINGVIPLFYSENSKNELAVAFARKIADKSDEEIFLEAYNINDYERPSVTVDIVATTMLGEASGAQKAGILLIKRGEHPFMNKWALPGGFVKGNETLTECANRELKEETNIDADALLPVSVHSEPERDPRGRIISNLFVSILSREDLEATGGDDAIDAKWFTVDFKRNDDILDIELKCEDIEIKLSLKKKKVLFGKPVYEVLENTGLAFDHGVMIAEAFDMLRASADNYDVILEFLPEKFTLTSFQKVQEVVLDAPLLPANFRRKVTPYLEETGEYVLGNSHRPAMLYKKKK